MKERSKEHGNCSRIEDPRARARARTILNHPLLGVWNRLPPEGRGEAPDTDGYDIS